MVHFDISYGETKVNTVVEFGEGTLLVNTVLNEVPHVIIKTSETPGEIGARAQGSQGQNSDEWKPQVLLSFSSIESVDVLIDALNEVRNKLKEL